MDKNKKNKIKEFFKKEGFYVVLFVCLCVVAVVATISTRNSNKNDVANENKEFSLDITENESDKTTNNPMDNAELVDNGESAQTSANAQDNKQESTGANAKVTETILHFPVEGSLSMAYKEGFVNESGDAGRTSASINIAAKKGAEVKAAGEGVVEEVITSNATKGAYVKIKHTDGRYTAYGNLDSNILVKKGDAVTSNTVIGKIGNTATSLNGTKYENDLIFEYYLANNEPQDPTLIFKYTKSN